MQHGGLGSSASPPGRDLGNQKNSRSGFGRMAEIFKDMILIPEVHLNTHSTFPPAMKSISSLPFLLFSFSSLVLFFLKVFIMEDKTQITLSIPPILFCPIQFIPPSCTAHSPPPCNHIQYSVI